MRHFTVFISGALFAAGLAVAGMTQPSKVVGFLDFFGNWDPSLAFVMGGAILAHFPTSIWMKRRASPLWGGSFRIPTRRDVDGRLLGGAALFGVGWGLGGFCPGPGLVSLTALSAESFAFVLSMMAGMILFAAVDGAFGKSERAHQRTAGHEIEVRGG